MTKEKMLAVMKLFFNDRGRTPTETRDGLIEAREQADTMINAIDEDLSAVEPVAKEEAEEDADSED